MLFKLASLCWWPKKSRWIGKIFRWQKEEKGKEKKEWLSWDKKIRVMVAEKTGMPGHIGRSDPVLPGRQPCQRISSLYTPDWPQSHSSPEGEQCQPEKKGNATQAGRYCLACPAWPTCCFGSFEGDVKLPHRCLGTLAQLLKGQLFRWISPWSTNTLLSICANLLSHG